MRFVIVAVLCTGCPVQGNECNVDNECDPAQVCARDHACVSPDQVRATRTTWKVNNQDPSTSVCSVFDFEFQILFKLDLDDTSEDKLGFAPVPCFTGLFTVDKLPDRYRVVKLLNEQTNETLENGTAVFDVEGNAEILLTTP